MNTGEIKDCLVEATPVRKRNEETGTLTKVEIPEYMKEGLKEIKKEFYRLIIDSDLEEKIEKRFSLPKIAAENMPTENVIKAMVSLLKECK